MVPRLRLLTALQGGRVELWGLKARAALQEEATAADELDTKAGTQRHGEF